MAAETIEIGDRVEYLNQTWEVRDRADDELLLAAEPTLSFIEDPPLMDGFARCRIKQVRKLGPLGSADELAPRVSRR